MNKYLIAVFAFALTTICSHAQTAAGNMMLGGAIAITSESYQSGTSSASFGLTPSFGYFVSDQLAVGTSISIATSRTGTGSGKTVNTAFGIGPFARFYKFTSNDNFAIFGQATFQFATGKTDPPSGNVSHSNAVSLSVSPGAAYFLSEHWAAEVSLVGFSISSVDPDTDNQDDKYTSVQFGLSSFSPTLGFRYHF